MLVKMETGGGGGSKQTTSYEIQASITKGSGTAKLDITGLSQKPIAFILWMSNGSVHYIPEGDSKIVQYNYTSKIDEFNVSITYTDNSIEIENWNISSSSSTLTAVIFY